MTGRPYILAETPWKTVKSTAYSVAVLPWGATEAHNLHLPHGTDIMESDYIASESARIAWDAGAKVIVLPTIPYGVNTGQMDIKLTVNMNPTTQAAILRDIVDSLSGQGIRKLVILNSHGGNDFRQMVRELQLRNPEMFICSINWWQIVDQRKYFDEADDHAGEMETSVMLNIAPHLVLPLEEAGEGKSRKFKLAGLRERWVWTPRQWTKVTDDTGVGNPKRATAEKGAGYLKAATEKIGDFFKELAAADIDDLYEK
ncbi:MAG TPA: creatininase family protein [Bacteroidota bacterium]|nr:creatininase family protein [Bacteroidota bacterium]